MCALALAPVYFGLGLGLRSVEKVLKRGETDVEAVILLRNSQSKGIKSPSSNRAYSSVMGFPCLKQRFCSTMLGLGKYN